MRTNLFDYLWPALVTVMFAALALVLHAAGAWTGFGVLVGVSIFAMVDVWTPSPEVE